MPIVENYFNEHLTHNNNNKLFSEMNTSGETVKSKSRYFRTVGKGESKISPWFIALNLNAGNRTLTE